MLALRKRRALAPSPCGFGASMRTLDRVF